MPHAGLSTDYPSPNLEFLYVHELYVRRRSTCGRHSSVISALLNTHYFEYHRDVNDGDPFGSKRSNMFQIQREYNFVVVCIISTTCIVRVRISAWSTVDVDTQLTSWHIWISLVCRPLWQRHWWWAVWPLLPPSLPAPPYLHFWWTGEREGGRER